MRDAKASDWTVGDECVVTNSNGGARNATIAKVGRKFVYAVGEAEPFDATTYPCRRATTGSVWLMRTADYHFGLRRDAFVQKARRIVDGINRGTDQARFKALVTELWAAADGVVKP